MLHPVTPHGRPPPFDPLYRREVMTLFSIHYSRSLSSFSIRLLCIFADQVTPSVAHLSKQITVLKKGKQKQKTVVHRQTKRHFEALDETFSGYDSKYE